MNSGALYLASAAGLCFIGFDIVGIVLVGAGVLHGKVKVEK